MRVVALAVAAMSFTVYGLAIGRFFARPDGMTARMRGLSLIGTVAAVIHFIAIVSTPQVPATRAAAGLALYLAGLGLFVWAWHETRRQPLPIAFSTTSAKQVVTAGPYRWLRHPFYTAYSLTWAAGSVLSQTTAAILAAGVMIAIYVVTAWREERQLLASPLGPMYRSYQRRVWDRRDRKRRGRPRHQHSRAHP